MLAILLALAVFGVAKLEDTGILLKPVSQYVTTGEDFIEMKKWVASMLKDATPRTIAVTGEIPDETGPLIAAYESMQPYKDGVIVSYTDPLPIAAQGNGLVIFTGFTRESGKTITVMYDDGDEVTYGFVGTFSKLPYTAVKEGDTLALLEEGTMYLMVKRNGVKLDASLMPTYLSGGNTSLVE
ncbi:hypothetical protein AU377_01760 [Sporosarcina sp. HYO08]|nr:hypothetical protein AU377_01760 [Sporosarcina sp. HYO08]